MGPVNGLLGRRTAALLVCPKVAQICSARRAAEMQTTFGRRAAEISYKEATTMYLQFVSRCDCGMCVAPSKMEFLLARPRPTECALPASPACG